MEFEGELPEYVFHKSTNLTPEEQVKGIEELKHKEFFPKPRSTDEMKWYYESAGTIANSIGGWIEDRLGLKVRDRLKTATNKIKLYNADEWVELRRKYGKPDNWVGGNVGLSNEIIMPPPSNYRNDRDWGYATTHELFHSASRTKIRADKDVEASTDEKTEYKNVDEVYAGYEVSFTNKLKLFDEVIVDMMSLEFAKDYNQEAGGKYITETVGYVNGVIFFDMVFEKMAEKLGKTPKEIREEFYKGNIRGDFKPLFLFNRVFGSKAGKTIMNLPLESGGYPSILSAFASDFEIDSDELDRRVAAHKSGQDVSVLGGINIKRWHEEAI